MEVVKQGQEELPGLSCHAQLASTNISIYRGEVGGTGNFSLCMSDLHTAFSTAGNSTMPTTSGWLMKKSTFWSFKSRLDEAYSSTHLPCVGGKQLISLALAKSQIAKSFSMLFLQDNSLVNDIVKELIAFPDFEDAIGDEAGAIEAVEMNGNDEVDAAEGEGTDCGTSEMEIECSTKLEQQCFPLSVRPTP